MQDTSTRPLPTRITSGLLGLVVGNALGVPVEFRSRIVLKQDPVVGMGEYGSHLQPAGTWSDDSSMALITTEALLTGYDPDEIMADFRRWIFENYWTPHGRVFDIGATTREALFRYDARKPSSEWGGKTERSNGNGGIMRVLPVAFFDLGGAPERAARRAAEVSALSHAHVRSQLCCALFVLVVRGVLRGASLRTALREASSLVEPTVPLAERPILEDLLSGQVFDRDLAEVRSGGYVVHSLEAALWCCERYPDYRSAVLAAVNLGQDTDTTAAVTGALAGVLHGNEAIPAEWLEVLARREEVFELVGRFTARYAP